MGKTLSVAAILSILSVLVASVASSRVLLDDQKIPNPVTPTKSNLSESSHKPPPSPNSSTNPGSSAYSPPPTKPENRSAQNSTSGEQSKKYDGPGGNPSNSTSSTTDMTQDDRTKSGSPASKSHEQGKGGNPSPPKNSSVDKEVKTCTSSSNKCHHEELVACLLHSREDSRNLSLLVQNIGDADFDVNITGGLALQIAQVSVSLAKNSSKEFNLTINDWKNIDILVNVSTGGCSLHIATPVPDWNPFQRFPAYEIRLTPIYGVYILVVSVVLVGGTWACCRFRKKGNRDSGIPYQQLEMGEQPQSGSAVDSNVVDGWDNWDDDWDDEAVTRPSEQHTAGSVSSNGLTSRTPKKGGWDADWDD